jgi:hypothetical protein
MLSNLFDPNAPGPTLDPSLLDPASAGPTIDPTLFDADSPRPTLDPAVLDPSAPGETLGLALLHQDLVQPDGFAEPSADFSSQHFTDPGLTELAHADPSAMLDHYFDDPLDLG